MSDQSHNEEFDQYLDIQDDDTQPVKLNNQIQSNVEAALAAYAQLVQVGNTQSNIDTEILDHDDKTRKIEDEKSLKQKETKTKKSKDSTQSKKKKTSKNKKIANADINSDKHKNKEQTIETGLNTLIMETPKKVSVESLKNKLSYNNEIPEGMNIIKFSNLDENVNENISKKRKIHDVMPVEFKVNKERLVPKKLKTSNVEEPEKRKKKETPSNYKPLHNKSKIFSEAEDELIKKLIKTHCKQHGVTMIEFIDLIWMNDNAHKVAKTEFWKLLADEFPDRSRSSLYKHVKRKYNNFKPRGKWTKTEDLKLKELCDEHDNKWNIIGQHMERMPEDCRDRYRNYVKHNKHLDEDEVEDEEEPKKKVSRWAQDELYYLKDIISLIMNFSMKFYLNYCYAKSINNETTDKFKKWDTYLTKEIETLLEKEKIKEKENEVYLLVLNAVNLNKTQSSVTGKFKKNWIDMKAEITNTIKEKNDRKVYPEMFDLFFADNDNLLAPEYFLMDIQKIINWTFISDLFSNGRTRIQVRYKCKSLIKTRITKLEKEEEEKYKELLPSILEALEKTGADLNDGVVFEDEIDWFHAYARWIEIVEMDKSIDFYKNFNVDPWLMKEIYSYLKHIHEVPEPLNKLNYIIEYLQEHVKL